MYRNIYIYYMNVWPKNSQDNMIFQNAIFLRIIRRSGRPKKRSHRVENKNECIGIRLNILYNLHMCISIVSTNILTSINKNVYSYERIRIYYNVIGVIICVWFIHCESEHLFQSKNTYFKNVFALYNIHIGIYSTLCRYLL